MTYAIAAACVLVLALAIWFADDFRDAGNRGVWRRGQGRDNDDS